MVSSNPSQASMDVAVSILTFVQGGVVSNWYGLGCPLHCGYPAWPSLFASLLRGLILGFALATFLFLHCLGFRVQSTTTPWTVSSSPAATRLSRYLYEQPRHRQ